MSRNLGLAVRLPVSYDHHALVLLCVTYYSLCTASLFQDPGHTEMVAITFGQLIGCQA